MEIKSLWRKCVIFVAGLLLAVTFPFFLLLVLLPLGLFRYFIAKLAKVLRPDLGKMLSTRSAVLAIDQLYTHPRCNIVFGGVMAGQANLTIGQNLMHKLVYEFKTESGELKYPELTQGLVTWGGHFFWKDAPNFDLKSHIRQHVSLDGSPFTEEDLEPLMKHLLNAPWTKGQPLWELVLVENYAHPSHNPHAIVFLRISHALADGFSILFLLLDLFRLYDPLLQLEDKVTHSPTQRPSSSFFLHILTLPFELAETLMSMRFRKLPFKSDTHLWSRKNDTQMKLGFDIALTPSVPLSIIKEIKDHFQVSFSAVVMSAFGGALRDMLLQWKGNHPRDVSYPTLPTSIIIPMPGHTFKLRNYLTLGIFSEPLGVADPVQRLKACHNEFEALHKSTIPLAFRFLYPLGGLLPHQILRVVFPLSNTVPCGISNFPGPKFKKDYDPLLVDMFFTNGLLPGDCGVGLAALSLRDHMRFCVAGDDTVFGDGETQHLKDLMLHHIRLLHDMALSNTPSCTIISVPTITIN